MEVLLPRLSPRGVWVSLAPPQGVQPMTEFFPLVLRERLHGWWGVRTPTQELGWCLLQILRSQCVDQILIDESLAGAWGEGDAPERIAWLRRLQIAAERGGGAVIFLREQPSQAGLWPIAIQVQAHRVGQGADASVQVQFRKWFSRRMESKWGTHVMPASSFRHASG